MIKKRLIITSSLSIVLVAMLLIGSTYSIFTTTEIDEDANVYTTGNLNVTYTLSSSNVQMTDVTPMTEEEAESVQPYRITVKNNGNVPYMFDVILTDTTSSSDNTIDYQYIMTKVGYLAPKKLSNCTNNVIKEDVIVPAGESVDIDVRVWLGSNLSNSEMGKSFYGKLSIDGLAIYDDNTDIDNDVLSINMMKTLFNTWTDKTYFKSDEYRTYIKNASFVDYIESDTSKMVTSWDVSESSDNSIIAWLEDNGTTDGEGNSYYNLYIGSNEKIYNKDFSLFFYTLSSLESVTFDNLDTTLTTTMGSMFESCTSLVSLDLSSFDTSNVTTMSSMFRSCSKLITLDLSSFDTSNVTSMYRMFNSCGITTLDVSNFNTSSVVTMNSMFDGCSSLTTLDLSSFDTSNVTSMEFMFTNCLELTTLDVSNFNTSNVTSMDRMFFSCKKLTSLDLSSFDTSNVTNMQQMFMYCNGLTTLDLSSFDTSNVTNIQQIFLESTVSDTGGAYFDLGSVTNANAAFQTARNIQITISVKQANADYYSGIFGNAATNNGSKIIADYTSETSSLVDTLIEGRTNIVKGSLVA